MNFYLKTLLLEKGSRYLLKVDLYGKEKRACGLISNYEK